MENADGNSLKRQLLEGLITRHKVAESSTQLSAGVMSWRVFRCIFRLRASGTLSFASFHLLLNIYSNDVEESSHVCALFFFQA